MQSFTEALTNLDLKAVRGIPKSDLHNHCLLGGRLKQIEKFTGDKLEKFRSGDKGISGINDWIGTVFRPVFDRPGALQAVVEAAFLQAKSDGITVLEMSVDVTIGRLFHLQPEEVISILKNAHQKIAPEIEYRPEIGMAKVLSLRTVLSCIGPYLDSGYFRSIDLYDIETAQSVHNYASIYKHARKLGLKCKAHAGEFGSAESVREAVEILELDAVQHGIGAAGSPEVMKWLAGLQIPLNVCPTSNIRLGRVRGYKSHPIRILADHGVRVTINTDDALVFGDGTSEQYRKLFKAGVFSADDLNLIRKNGLED